MRNVAIRTYVQVPVVVSFKNLPEKLYHYAEPRITTEPPQLELDFNELYNRDELIKALIDAILEVLPEKLELQFHSAVVEVVRPSWPFTLLHLLYLKPEIVGTIASKYSGAILGLPDQQFVHDIASESFFTLPRERRHELQKSQYTTFYLMSSLMNPRGAVYLTETSIEILFKQFQKPIPELLSLLFPDATISLSTNPNQQRKYDPEYLVTLTGPYPQLPFTYPAFDTTFSYTILEGFVPLFVPFIVDAVPGYFIARAPLTDEVIIDPIIATDTFYSHDNVYYIRYNSVFTNYPFLFVENSNFYRSFHKTFKPKKYYHEYMMKYDYFYREKHRSIFSKIFGGW